MCDYELCPICGSSLDIGEKCSFCKPLVTPIPKHIYTDESYKAVVKIQNSNTERIGDV